MTKEEAMEIIRLHFCMGCYLRSESEECKQYACYEALQMAKPRKQIPMKPKKDTVDLGIFGTSTTYVCGCCNAPVRYRYEYNEPIDMYCWKCGQAIDWEELQKMEDDGKCSQKK